MMKTSKTILRMWIALASVMAFLLGWIGLAHSPKPVQAKSNSTTTVTTTQLEPLPPMPSLSQVQQQSSFSAPSTFQSAPSPSRQVFRSSGS